MLGRGFSAGAADGAQSPDSGHGAGGSRGDADWLWVALLAGAVRRAAPGVPVQFGAHLPSLMTDTHLRIDDLASELDDDCMHAYPLYCDAAKGFLDPELVPFACALTADLSATGRAPLMHEFGICTAPAGAPGVTITDDFLGCPLPQYLASEAEGALYYQQVLERLASTGAAGAYAWRYGDCDAELFNRAPFDTAVRERSFGLVRADGSEKPVCDVLRSFASSLATGRRIKSTREVLLESGFEVSDFDSWRCGEPWRSRLREQYCSLRCCLVCKIKCKEMPMERKCRYVPLSKQPLVLVLGQVRFSPVRQMADYIPAIQEEFRRHGFPLERAGKIQQLIFGPGGGVPVQVVEQQRWEYRTKDETWSVLVMQDSVVLQTTSYERFEGFAEKLLHAVRTVLTKTEHDQLGVVQRVGLRYVDVVQPRDGEDFRFYLRPGFHGVADEVFKTGTHRLHVESTGKTTAGDVDGTMVVRVVQNDQGFSLPPDLLGAAPKHTPRAKSGELITLVDMDHYIEGTFDPSADWIVARAYEMHDHLVETLHDHVVTPEAIEVWK